MSPDHYHVLVEPMADRKFAYHIEFLARVNELAAAQLYESYEEAIEYLQSTPESCPPYFPQLPSDSELRCKLFGKRYRIVFEILGDEVYIYDIQDCRQDEDKNLI